MTGFIDSLDEMHSTYGHFASHTGLEVGKGGWGLQKCSRESRFFALSIISPRVAKESPECVGDGCRREVASTTKIRGFSAEFPCLSD